MEELSFLLLVFQAEDGIRDRSPSRGLGDVYKRQVLEKEKEEKENSNLPQIPQSK